MAGVPADWPPSAPEGLSARAEEAWQVTLACRPFGFELSREELNLWISIQDELLRPPTRDGVPISAVKGEGIATLLEELSTQLRPVRDFVELRVPHEQAAVIARLHAVGQVVESRYLAKTARFKVRIPPHFHHEFAKFIVA